MDRPDAPEDLAADALRFERAEHDPAIFEHDRVQRAGDVQMADLLEVRRVSSSPMLVSRSSMTKSCSAIGRVALRRAEAVAVAGERKPPAGQRTRAHVVDAVLDSAILPSSGVRKSLDQFAAPVLGVNCWLVSRTIFCDLRWIL